MTGGRVEDVGILAVWKALGGAELRGGRGKAFWRSGAGYNVSLDVRRGVWKDHVTGAGGGILDLIAVALGVDRRAALVWARQTFGLVMPNHSESERREWRRRRVSAEAAARALAERTEAYLLDLATGCGMLLRRYHGLMDLAYQRQDVDLVARAESVYLKLEELTARRDFLRTAPAAAVADFFARIGGRGVAA